MRSTASRRPSPRLRGNRPDGSLRDAGEARTRGVATNWGIASVTLSSHCHAPPCARDVISIFIPPRPVAASRRPRRTVRRRPPVPGCPPCPLRGGARRRRRRAPRRDPDRGLGLASGHLPLPSRFSKRSEPVQGAAAAPSRDTTTDEGVEVGYVTGRPGFRVPTAPDSADVPRSCA